MLIYGERHLQTVLRRYPATTTVTARTNPAGNGHPTTTRRSSRGPAHWCSVGEYSAA